MKKIFTLLLTSIFTIAIWAQSPNKLSYQAVVRDADNNLISEQAVGMQISILQSSATGTAVYTETHTPTTNVNGLVTVEIGGGATADDFSTIDWAAGPYFIKTEIDPDGSTNYTITGTSQLLSVPYAKYADKAGNVFSGDYADLSDTPTNVSDFTNDAGYLTEVTGTETAFDGWDKDEDPWVLNGNDLSYEAGNVAIGTSTAPDRPLTIYDGSLSFVEFMTANSGTSAASGLVVGINSSNNAFVRNYENGSLYLGTNGSTNLSIDENGEVGIGTESPDAGLDVEATTKFGVSGVVFSELREITGTTSPTSYFNVITLPSGYTEDNTRVLNIEINYTGDRWSGIGHDNNNADRSTSYIINESSLYVYYPDLVAFQNRPIRILIMKVE